MKFVFYYWAVSLMPRRAWRHFWQQFNIRFGDMVTLLVKNECPRNFKSQVCNTNRKQDLPESS